MVRRGAAEPEEEEEDTADEISEDSTDEDNRLAAAGAPPWVSESDNPLVSAAFAGGFETGFGAGRACRREEELASVEYVASGRPGSSADAAPSATPHTFPTPTSVRGASWGPSDWRAFFGRSGNDPAGSLRSDANRDPVAVGQARAQRREARLAARAHARETRRQLQAALAALPVRGAPA